jgi:hypothetical protein
MIVFHFGAAGEIIREFSSFRAGACHWRGLLTADFWLRCSSANFFVFAFFFEDVVAFLLDIIFNTSSNFPAPPYPLSIGRKRGMLRFAVGISFFSFPFCVYSCSTGNVFQWRQLSIRSASQLGQPISSVHMYSNPNLLRKNLQLGRTNCLRGGCAFEETND